MLEVKNVSKRFRAIQALAHVHVTVRRGTIHAVVGENGAGKSTLGKIIGGVLSPDDGELLLEGRTVAWRSPREALANGITTITQETALLTKQRVIDNVFSGIESNRHGWIDEREMLRRFAALEEESGFGLPADAPVSALAVADQKKVEVLRALARRARMIVMDEPTASLADRETETFVRIVRSLRDLGTTVIYVSHFLEEVLALADDITVMRNGQVVRSSPRAAETVESLVQGMLGKSIDQMYPARRRPPGDDAPVLSARGVSQGTRIRDISFDLHRGEILGVAGLVGSGRSRLMRSLFGAEPRTAGDIYVDGVPRRIRSVSDAIAAGIGMLPEDRKVQGLALKQSVGDNLSLPHLKTVARLGWIRAGRERFKVDRAMDEADIRPRRPAMTVGNLSGGNQQKVLFGKWLFHPPKVLIADEPTRGVDVGAKRAIYELIVSLAEQGMAVLMVSSEIEELLGVAHRILVMHLGRIVGEFDNDGTLNHEDVMRPAFLADAQGQGLAGRPTGESAS